MTKKKLQAHLKGQGYPVKAIDLRSSPNVDKLSDEDKNFIRSLPNGVYESEDQVVKALGL